MTRSNDSASPERFPPSFIAWQPTPSARAAVVRSLLAQLDKSQWQPAPAIALWQECQLTALLAHASVHSPYYRAHLPRPARTPRRNPAPRLHDLPLLSRETLQGQYAAICTAIRPVHHGPVQELQTSGSTGQPVKVRRTGLCQLYWTALTLRDHFWHRRDFTATLAAIRTHVGADGGNPTATAWNATAGAAPPAGRLHSLPITTDVGLQAEWLARLDPDYLLTYPTNLAALLRLVEAGEIRLPRLREIRTIAETLPDGVRADCSRLLGVPITDLYSSQELGIIALQCPESGLYHIQAENLIVEILDDRGQPCAPGEIGRVVATDLHNFATPLIRYELGDYAETGPPCPCGRGLPTLRRIVGRERNMVRFPDGRRHWPVVGFHRFREVLPTLKQYQLIQRSLERIDVRLVVGEHAGIEQENALADVIRKALGHPFELHFDYCSDALPRSPGGKHQEFICELAG